MAGKRDGGQTEMTQLQPKSDTFGPCSQFTDQNLLQIYRPMNTENTWVTDEHSFCPT